MGGVVPLLLARRQRRGILDLFTLTRTQASGARSTALDVDDLSFRFWNVNERRLTRSQRRLLIEPERTNLMANPNAISAAVGVVGSGGAFATGWGVAGGVPAWLTVEVVAIGTVYGLPTLTLRFSTASAGATSFQFVVGATITTVSGQPYTGSVRARHAAGVLPPSITIATVSEAGSTPITITSAPTRFSHTTTVTGTTGRRPVLTFGGMTLAQPYDWTVELAAPQAELGSYRSSPIYPAAGASGSMTRGRDDVSLLLATIYATNQRIDLLGEILLPNQAVGTPQTIFQVDDGSDANRYVVRNVAGSNDIELLRVLASAASTPVVVGAMTPGTPFQLQMIVYGSGRAKARMATAGVWSPPVFALGGPTTGLTTVRLGSNAAGGDHMLGEVGSLTVADNGLRASLLAETGGALLNEDGGLLLVE